MPCHPTSAGEAEQETFASQHLGEQSRGIIPVEDHVASQTFQRQRQGTHSEEKGEEHF